MAVSDRFPVLYGLDGFYAAVLHEAIDPEVEEVLDEGLTLRFELPFDEKAELVVEDAEIIFDGHRYKVTSKEVSRASTARVEVEGTGIYIELLDVAHVGVVEVLTKSPAVGLGDILVGSGWTAGTVEDGGVTVATLAETNRTVLWLVRTWARLCGLEVEWDTIDRIVHLRAAIGTDRAARFQYRRNIREIRRKTAPPQATRIWPTGRNGLDIASVNLGQRFLEDFSWYTATQGLTLAEAQARFTKDYVFNDDRFLNADALMAYAERRLAFLAQPITSYETTILDLQALTGVQEPFGLGDPVTVVDLDLGIDVSARIVRYVRHPKTPWSNTVELAYLIPGLETAAEDQGISSELALLGEQLVYGENEVEMAFGTIYTEGIILGVSSYSFTNAKAGLLLVGTASAETVLEIEVVYGSSIVRTLHWPVHVGLNTVAAPFIIGGIPEGSVELFFRLRTGTGTFVVAAFAGQFWIEAKNVAGGAVAGSPDQYVFDTAPANPYTVTDQVAYDLQAPLGASALESVPGPSVTASASVTLV